MVELIAVETTCLLLVRMHVQEQVNEVGMRSVLVILFCLFP